MKKSSHDKTSTPIPVADANVHFRLNLSPKAALNHKRKWVITLAYDHFSQKPQQNITPDLSVKWRIKNHSRIAGIANSDIYHHKRDNFPDSKKTRDEKN
ncbi:hypothetical protein CRX67_01740 [Enterobacteriaceae bacterium A-F18]|nr:hypothetical protein CRX67_01740 [Enterobacteriaceae bacterium A-F18]